MTTDSHPLKHVVVVTGNIGAGKSTVATMLARPGVLSADGATLIDADALARSAVLPGSVGLTRIVDAFGGKVLTAEGTLNRGALGAIVFSDQRARETLEAITHPIVREGFLAQAIKAFPGPVVYDCPLFFESKVPLPPVKAVLLVHAPLPLRLMRLAATRGGTPEAWIDRAKAQMPSEAKFRDADVIAVNNRDLETLAARVVWASQSRLTF